MNKKLVAVAVLCIIAISLLAYNEFSVSRDVRGVIRVSGAFALYPLMVKWAEEYQKLHPKLKIEVSAGGAGKGMTDALSGLVEIGMISREISPAEIAKGAFFVAVTEGAVVATINSGNPLLDVILKHGLTRQMLYDIFIAGNITSWGQAVGQLGGVKYSIHVYTRSDAAGAADTWTKYLGGKSQDDLKGIGVYADPGIVEAVKSDIMGIGFNNLAYAYDNSTQQQISGITVVPVDMNGNGQIDAQESFYSSKAKLVQAVQQGYYMRPAQTLYLVTKGAFTGVTKEFAKWILTDGQSFVEGAGYVPLPQSRIDSQLAKLES
jgi:phosphate transport system substrate-binding protein